MSEPERDDSGPPVIYLQTWASEVSWCDEPIGSMDGHHDVKYIRADLVVETVMEDE